MLDAYASAGLPIGYPHWSYGKEFIRNEQFYRRGMQGLAYEIVINSNPCIAYLMEENSMAMQARVIGDRLSGGSGKSVSVRDGLGGRGIIKEKTRCSQSTSEKKKSRHNR